MNDTNTNTGDQGMKSILPDSHEYKVIIKVKLSNNQLASGSTPFIPIASQIVGATIGVIVWLSFKPNLLSTTPFARIVIEVTAIIKQENLVISNAVIALGSYDVIFINSNNEFITAPSPANLPPYISNATGAKISMKFNLCLIDL